MYTEWKFTKISNRTMTSKICLDQKLVEGSYHSVIIYALGAFLSLVHEQTCYPAVSNDMHGCNNKRHAVTAQTAQTRK